MEEDIFNKLERVRHDMLLSNKKLWNYIARTDTWMSSKCINAQCQKKLREEKPNKEQKQP